MMSAILLFLVVADVALVFAFLRLSRKQQEHQQFMVQLTEERAMLNDLRQSVREELTSAQIEVKLVKEQVQVLAMEAEQEVKQGIQTISGEIEQIMLTLAERLDGPLNAVTDKQHYVENLIQRLQREKVQLTRLTNRASQLTRFFKEDLPFDEVLKDIEDKKFSDIRALLAQGVKPDRIARDLNVAEQEVRLISGLTP